jgi:hypothetical protein
MSMVFVDCRNPRGRSAWRVAWLAVGLVAASCGGGTPAPASPSPGTTTQNATIYTQAARYPLAYDSQTSEQPTGSGLMSTDTFDDFTSTTGGTVRSLTWQGLYCTKQAGAPAPTPTASSFFVGFFPDQNGSPDMQAPLASSTYAVAQTAQSPAGTDTAFNCDGVAGTSAALYNYTLTLAVPFTAAAGTRYWIEVAAITPDYTVYWGWNSGIGGNGHSVQFFGSQMTQFASDRAFTLRSQ